MYRNIFCNIVLYLCCFPVQIDARATNKKISIDELRYHASEVVVSVVNELVVILQNVSILTDENNTMKNGERYVIIKEKMITMIIDNLAWAQDLSCKFVDDPTQFSRSDLERIISEAESRLLVIKKMV